MLLLLLFATAAEAQVTSMPLPPLPGDASSWAFGINARGEVVGYSNNVAVVWDRDRTPTPLPPR